ncbi:hypothetical protein FS837_002634 [Tulasnella sp. UAMH 9824]|nr:hypothetical protein FS837_002634 [Tulasnella sp. UAMH 9824]
MATWDAIPQPEASLAPGEPRSVKEVLLPAAGSDAATGNESPLSSSNSPSPTLSPRLSDSRSAVSSDPNTPSVPFINLPTKSSLPDGEWLAQTLNPSHPIHRLPIELLVLVFQLGTWADPATFPTIISQVSPAWRTLALSTSSLWTYINLCGSDPYAKARLWISRALSSSSLSTLHISLDMSEGFDPSPGEMQEAMAVLLPYIERWGSFSVHADPDALQTCLEILSSLPETLRAKRLKHLRIESTEFDAEEQWNNLFNDDLPALESIRLAGVSVPWNGPLFMEGVGLKHLHIGMFGEDSPGAPSLVEFVAILTRNAGTLISLTVDESNITHDGSDPELEKELVLPNLERLQMTQLDRDVYFWMTFSIEALVWDPNEPSALALKELTFVATQGLSAEVLTRIVKSRNEARQGAEENGDERPNPPKLEKLVLRGCPVHLTDEEMTYLKSFVAEVECSDFVEGTKNAWIASKAT